MNNRQVNTPQANILIVDDKPDNLRFLHHTLNEQGYTVRPARSGPLALDSVQADLPDLILLDITMPGMDGYEVCEHLKNNERTSDVPVIFISARNDLSDKVKAFSLGAVDYITKPFEAQEVLARVRTHLALNFLQQQLIEQNNQLQQEIIERQQTEAVLRESERRLDLALRASRSAEWDWDIPTGKVVRNPLWAKMLDYDDPAQIDAHIDAWEERIHPDDVLRVMAAINAHLAGDTILYESQYRLQNRVGGWVWVHDHGQIVECDADDNPLQIIGTHRDITEQKMAEGALRESEGRYRVLFDHAPVSLWEEDWSETKRYIDQLRTEGVSDFQAYFLEHPEAIEQCVRLIKILDINSATLSFFESPNKADFLANAMGALGVEEAFEHFSEEITALAQGNLCYEGESFSRVSSGEIRRTFVNLSIVPGYEENWEKVFVSIIDITEQKRTEEALAKSMESLAEAQRIANLGNWDWDITQGKLVWSDLTFDIFGLEPQALEATYETFLDRVHPDDRDHVTKTVEGALAGEPYNLEHRVVWPDGTVRIVHEQAEVTWNDTGEPTRIVGTVQDITERKLAEQALAESVSLLQATLESTADGILTVDVAGRITSVNHKFSELWRIPAAMLDAQDANQIFDFAQEQLQDPASFRLKMQELHDNPETESSDVLHFKDGRVFERYSRPQQIAQQIVGRVWSFRDITEQTQAVTALSQERNLLQTLINTMPDYVYIKDVESRFILANKPLLRQVGFKSADEVIGKTDFDFHAPELAAQYFAIEQQIISSGQAAINFEEPFVDQLSDLERISLSSKVPLRDDSGQIIGLLGVNRDITERKQAERVLAESVSLLQATLESTADGILVIDKNGTITNTNQRYIDMLQVFGEEHMPSSDIEVFDLFRKHLKDPDQYINRAQELRTKLDVESFDTLLFKNGLVFERYSRPQWVENQVAGHVWSFRDVSEREQNRAALQSAHDELEHRVKERTAELQTTNLALEAENIERQRIEMALRESEEKFRTQYKGMPVPVFTWQWQESQDDFVLIDCNDAAVELSGNEIVQLFEKPAQEVYSNRPDMLDDLTRCFTEKTIIRHELFYDFQQGNMRQVDSTCVYVPPDLVMVHAEDVTEQRQSEEQVRASLQEKEVMLQEIHHRVKNNLQIVSSLLKFQARRLGDEQIAELFQNSHNRIRSMALIHEQLYRSKDLARVNFAEYTHSLIVHLTRSYEGQFGAVRFQMDLAEVYLDIESGVPCGLIINELVSNALIHAFPAEVMQDREGEIRVELAIDDDQQIRLMVSDNGAGIPPEVDVSETESLGLRLVNMLVEQLDGTLELERKNGTTFRITFAL